MGTYKPAKSKAGDSAAIGNTLAAFDLSIHETFGDGVISGMVLASSGIVSAGSAIVGHIVKEPGGTNIISQFVGTGTFDLYVQTPTLLLNSAGGGIVGTYPDASGAEIPGYVVVPTGTVPSGYAAFLATVTVASGAITSVTDKRTIIVTPANLSTAIARMSTKETVVYGVLSAPLPSAILFVAPSAMAITGINLYVGTAPVGASIIVQLQKSGMDVWTSANYPTIADGSYSVKATNPDGAYACVADEILMLQLMQVGSTTPGSDLMIVLSYRFV